MPDLRRLTLTEGEMTTILKKFLEQYAGAFDHATFDDVAGGYLVHFHQSPEPPWVSGAESERRTRAREEDPSNSYLPPISIFGGGGFSGFGGGSSGGGGASGDW